MSFVRRVLGQGRPEGSEPEDSYDHAPLDDQEQYDNRPLAPDPVNYAPPREYLYRAEPRSLEDAGVIADRIRDGFPVVVSLEHTDPAEAQRIRDFLRGAAYALRGDVRKVAGKVYACVPAGVLIERLNVGASAADANQPQAPMSSHTPAGGADVWPE